jgi:hypothetical protein
VVTGGHVNGIVDLDMVIAMPAHIIVGAILVLKETTLPTLLSLMLDPLIIGR